MNNNMDFFEELNLENEIKDKSNYEISIENMSEKEVEKLLKRIL